MKKAFTLIELIITIIIIGILASIAIPKLFSTRDDAQITKIRADVSTVRGAISSLHSIRLMKGNDSYPEALDDADINKEDEKLFDGNSSIGKLLDYPIYSKDANGHWMKTGDTNYTVKFMDVNVKFDYNKTNGHFDCDGINTGEANTTCNKITH